jgi:hypothetical protein
VCPQVSGLHQQFVDENSREAVASWSSNDSCIVSSVSLDTVFPWQIHGMETRWKLTTLSEAAVSVSAFTNFEW